MKKIITGLLLLCVFSLSAQKGQGSIKGTVTDGTKEAVPFANITLFEKGNQILGTTTDFDGKYLLKPVPEGTYEVQVSYVGFHTKTIKSVVVKADKITEVDVTITQGTNLQAVEILYERSLIEKDQTTSGATRSRAAINKLAVRSAGNIVKGKRKHKRSKNTNLVTNNVRGSRAGGSVTFIDGVRVIGSSSLPKSAVEEISVKVGGTSAQYANNKVAPKNKETFQHNRTSNRRQKENYNYHYQEVKKDAYAYLEEDYQDIADNLFESPLKAPLSTFSVDVDRASYANMRRYINDGYFPPQSAVRIEELINYFNYDYPQPEGDHPLSITTELADCPWNEERKLALIGIQGKEINMDDAPASNLVFLVDVSGSMSSPDKLALLKKGLKLLVEQMREEDKIAIVVYAGAAGVVLNSTHGDKKEKIKSVLHQLEAGGSTAGGAGIQLAYKIAKKNFIEGGNNRIILASDGDFNVGPSSQEELVKMIETERKGGVFLSVLGFGTGNLRDQMMEQIADHGNGNYNYIDNILEAKKVLVKEMGGTLFTIAKDVKVQAEFNPQLVKSYRLVGYVNRLLADEDFNDDKKDAGEMGSGHTVTVMYELILTDSKENVASIDALKYQKVDTKEKPTATAFDDEILTVKFRYKQPNEDHSTLISEVLKNETKRFVEASENFRFSASVASFGMKLRSSESAENISYKDVLEMAKEAKGKDREGYRAEFIKLVKSAELME